MTGKVQVSLQFGIAPAQPCRCRKEANPVDRTASDGLDEGLNEGSAMQKRVGDVRKGSRTIAIVEAVEMTSFAGRASRLKYYRGVDRGNEPRSKKEKEEKSKPFISLCAMEQEVCSLLGRIRKIFL